MKIGIAAMVLDTAQDFRRAGVARYAYELIDSLVGRYDQHEFHLFVLPTFEVPERWRSAPNFRVHRTWRRYNKWNVLVAGPIAHWLGLDFYFSTAHTVPYLTRVPTGLLVHDLFAFRHPEWFPEGHASFYKAVLPRSCRSAALVFVNSEATGRDVEQVLQVDRSKVVVTPLGPGEPISVAQRPSRSRIAELGIPFERYLLTLSTLEPRKNLDGLLRAFAQLADLPEAKGLGLVIAGGKGWKYEESLALIDELGLGERVHLLGYARDEDLPVLYAGCELFVYPSFEEGFGLPILEAMQAGAPVVCSNGGALPEVGGDAARYFDPHKVESISSAVLAALKDDREVWSVKGKQRAREFDWKRTADLTILAIERWLRRA